MNQEEQRLRRLMIRSTPKPNSLAVAGVALVCAVAAASIGNVLMSLGLLVFGGCLGCFAIANVMQRRTAEREELSRVNQKRMVDAAVQALVEHDSDVVFLTDGDGEIQFRNAAANERFGDVKETHLTDVFGTVLAHPEAILYRLQSIAGKDGAAKEDVVTRNGQFRLSVVQVGDKAFLWRVDDRGDAARSKV